MSEMTRSVPAIPRDYDALVKEYTSTIKAKIRSMRIWTQDVEDVYQHVLVTLIHRDVISKYHQRYAPEAPLDGLAARYNDKERKLYARFGQQAVWTVSKLTDVCFADADTKDRTSWTRNALRRLLRDGIVKPVSRGVYARVTEEGWDTHGVADNPLRFKRYLTLTVKRILMDWLKKQNRDAMSLRLMYVPGEGEDDYDVMSLLDRRMSPKDGDDVEALVSLRAQIDKVTGHQQELLDELTEPLFVDVPEEAASLPEGESVYVPYGDELVMGTVVLRRAEDDQLQRSVVLRPNRAQRLSKLGIVSVQMSQGCAHLKDRICPDREA